MDQEHAQDETAIREVVARVEKGWNAGDGDAYAAPFAEDAEYVVVDGRYVKGRNAIAAGHREILSSFYRGSANSMTVENIRFIRPDVAIARVLADLTFYVTGTPHRRVARSTWVLAHDGTEWEIVAFQNTPIAEPPAPSDGGQ